MLIGLYDADFFKYHQTIFNLELMKISTYYKKKKEITIMSPSCAPERYTKFFYRKDFNDGEFGLDLVNHNNIIYGGYAFSNNNYIPMAEEIECCIPDKSIYERFEKIFIEDNEYNKLYYTTIARGVHFRLSLDGKTIWSNFEKQIPKNTKGRVFFIHDFNLSNIDSAAEITQEILKRYCLSTSIKTSLCVKFPIICSDFNSFFKWTNFIFSSTNFKLQYNKLFTDGELFEITKKINMSQARNIIYNPFPVASSKNDFLESDLIKIFKQVLFLYKNQKPFLLIYSDNFFIPWEIKKFFYFLSSYCRSSEKGKKLSFYHYMKSLIKKEDKYNTLKRTTKQEIKTIFLYIYENYPNLFKLFYEYSGANFKGGEFLVER